jgi:putative transcriptional regulator
VTAKREFKSDAFEAKYSAAAGMLRAGTIDKPTMQHFDETCLAGTPPTTAVSIDLA